MGRARGAVLASVIWVSFLGTSARAQVADLTATPVAGTSATGGWHVVLHQTGEKEWSVTAQAAPSAPNGPVNIINLTFFGSSGQAINADMLAPGGNTGGTDAGGANWTTFVVGNYLSFTADPVVMLARNSGEGPPLFTGKVTLVSTDPIASVQADLRNSSGAKWLTTGPVTVPEPASAALLLPALAPLGLVLRRRPRASPLDVGA